MTMEEVEPLKTSTSASDGKRQVDGRKRKNNFTCYSPPTNKKSPKLQDFTNKNTRTLNRNK